MASLTNNGIDFINGEIRDLLIGDKIGEGAFRDVYQCRLNDKWVVKVEREYESYFHNAMEWHTWHDAKGSDFEKWFAPCHFISPNGKALVQSKTELLLRLPDNIPEFFCDCKIDNFGTIDDIIVCHDYGLHEIGKVCFANSKLKRIG